MQTETPAQPRPSADRPSVSGVLAETLRFAVTALAGCAVVIILAAPVKCAIIEWSIRASQDLLERGAAERALDRIKVAERWQFCYPVYTERIVLAVARAYAMKPDTADARWYGRSIRRFAEHPAVAGADEAGGGLWAALRRFSDGIMSRVQRAACGAAAWNPDCAYEAILSEWLRQSRERDLRELAAELGGGKSADPAAKQAAEYASFCLMAVRPKSATTADALASLEEKPPAPRITPAPAAPEANTGVAPPPPRAGGAGEAWGFVKNAETDINSIGGMKIGVAKFGTLAAISGVRVVNGIRMAVCDVNEGETRVSKGLICAADLEVFPGPLTDAGRKLRDLRVREAELASELEKKKAEWARKASQTDPAAVRFADVKKRYREFEVKAEALQRKMATASGADRVELIDKLHGLKGDEMRLRAEYERAKKAYEAWEAKQNTASVESPEIRALEEELAAVRKDLANT